jgi:hypothetical protein
MPGRHVMNNGSIPGFARRYQRPSDPDNPLNPMNWRNEDNLVNPMNQADLRNPASPMNRGAYDVYFSAKFS